MAAQPTGSGSTLSAIYSSAQRLRLELTSDLERLEQLESCSTSSSSASSSFHSGPGGGTGYGATYLPSVSGEVQVVSPRRSSANMQAASAELVQGMRVKLSALQRLSGEMDGLWRSHFNRTQRELWRRKVELVAEEAEALRQAVDKYDVRESRRQREASERAQLLMARATGEGARYISEIERDARDLDSAKRSNRAVEEMISQGIATLAQMSQHRELLKGAQRRALDVLNYVGLSETVLKRINRRQTVDKIIAYGGMLVTLVVVVVVWRWARGG